MDVASCGIPKIPLGAPRCTHSAANLPGSLTVLAQAANKLARISVLHELLFHALMSLVWNRWASCRRRCWRVVSLGPSVRCSGSPDTESMHVETKLGCRRRSCRIICSTLKPVFMWPGSLVTTLWQLRIPAEHDWSSIFLLCDWVTCRRCCENFIVGVTLVSGGSGWRVGFLLKSE